MNELVPVDPEASKAVQEVAKATGQSIEAATKFAQFWAGVFGTIPEDIVGLLGGDWLHHARIRNEFRLTKRTEEILSGRGIKELKMVSEDIARPILEAAREQNDDSLSELWARLLANAMDPNRSKTVRKSLVELLRQFDPLDAVVLKHFSSSSFDIAEDAAQGQPGIMTISNIGQVLKENSNEVEVSLLRLTDLHCLIQERFGAASAWRRWSLAAKGRQLLGAVS